MKQTILTTLAAAVKVVKEAIENRKNQAQVRKVQRMEREANELIQVKEENGRLYYAFDGTSLIEITEFKGDIVKVLYQSRQVYLSRHAQ